MTAFSLFAHYRSGTILRRPLPCIPIREKPMLNETQPFTRGHAESHRLLAPKKVRFSYSTADQPVLQRAVIQAIEKIGGQRKLKKLYFQHQQSVKGGENFFDAAIRLMRMKVEFDEAALALTPATGPVLFISNHPYGVLDGITLTWLATKVRPDTKVLANDVLCQAPEAAGQSAARRLRARRARRARPM